MKSIQGEEIAGAKAWRQERQKLHLYHKMSPSLGSLPDTLPFRIGCP